MRVIENARERHSRAGTSFQQYQDYRFRILSSSLRQRIPSRLANRSVQTATPPRRETSRDRAALTLLALAGNLQRSVHLTRAERTTGWGVFEMLLTRFVEIRHA